jgi:hypothetical protein
VSIVLLVSGPVLAAAYAAVNHAAIRTAAGAQRKGPEWAGGRVGADGLTSLGADVWWMVKGIALVVGLAAVGVAVVGLLLGRPGRARGFLLVLSGVLIVPYALGFAAALYNPVSAMAQFYDSPDFSGGIPSWQRSTALILLAGGLAQAVGAVRTAARGLPR